MAQPSPQVLKRPPNALALSIVMAISAVTLFSMMDALVKSAGAAASVAQIIFFRSLFAFLPIGLFAIYSGGLARLKPVRWQLHAVRTLAGMLAMACVFYTFTVMKLADAVAITFAAPIFATVLSIPLLGERVRLRRWSAIIVGFIGVLIVLRPGSGAFDLASLVAVVGALAMGFTTVIVKKLTQTDTPESIVFYFTIGTTVGALIFLPWFWTTPTTGQLAVLVLIGLLGGMAQILRTLAVKGADVSLLAPYNYLSLLWASIFGFLFWKELLDGWSIVGAVIIAAAGLYIAIRETRLR